MNRFLIVALVVLGVQLSSGQTLNKDVDCKCRLPVQSRIVGGEILQHPVPFMVSFQYKLNGNWEHQFGGTVLNRNWIMTSGRVEMYKNTTFFSNSIRVRVGISDLTTPVNSMNTFKVKQIITHGQYNWKKADTLGDISLVELDRPLEFTKTVQPACLSEVIEKFTEKPLEAIGFGSTATFRKGPYGFQAGSIKEPYVSNKLRHAFFNIDESLDTGCNSENGHLICAKPIMKKDSIIKNSICKGDMGSALINNKNGNAVVVGLAQYYNGRDEGNRWNTWIYCVENSFFARISNLIPFIQKTIGDDYCSKN